MSKEQKKDMLEDLSYKKSYLLSNLSSFRKYPNIETIDGSTLAETESSLKRVDSEINIIVKGDGEL